MLVGQFHELAELRFDRVKVRGIQRLFAARGGSRYRAYGKSHGGEGGKKCLMHVGISFRVQWPFVWRASSDVAFSRCVIDTSRRSLPSAESGIRKRQLAHSRSKVVIFSSRLRATASASELP